MMAGDVGGGLSPLDHAFNAMLMLAHVALVRGDRVGLMVYADRVRAYVPPVGRAQADRSAGARGPQPIPDDGRVAARPGVRRPGAALPEAVAGGA